MTISRWVWSSTLGKIVKTLVSPTLIQLHDNAMLVKMLDKACCENVRIMLLLFRGSHLGCSHLFQFLQG